jgi:hypothetical protein
MTREKTILTEASLPPLRDEAGKLILAEDAILCSPELRALALELHKISKRQGDIPDPSGLVWTAREEVAPAK